MWNIFGISWNIKESSQFMDLIFGLVSVWVKSKNGCGNNYKSQTFVRGPKKNL